jgi:hypothetical protein
MDLIVVAMGRDLFAVTALQGIALNAKVPLPDPTARTRVDPIVYISGRETGRPLVMTVDVVDRLTLDVSVFCCCPLGNGSRLPTATVTKALVDLAVGITAHEAPPSVEESHFNPRPKGNV